MVVEERKVIKETTYTFKRIVRVIERTIYKKVQFLLIADITLEGWWTDLAMAEEDVIELYRQHATSEQFHSEFKTDLDLERLPCGKFATNALVIALGVFTYNILRFLGQTGLIPPFGTDAAFGQAPQAASGDPGVDVSGRTADHHRSAIEAALQPTLPGLYRVQHCVFAAGAGQLRSTHALIASSAEFVG